MIEKIFLRKNFFIFFMNDFLERYFYIINCFTGFYVLFRVIFFVMVFMIKSLFL